MDDISKYISGILARVAAAKLFFIGGSMKSGTTWLQLLLDGHPQISCGGEAHLFDLLVPSLSETLDAHNHFIEDKNVVLFNELPGYPIFSPKDKLALYILAIASLLDEKAGHKKIQAIGERTPDNIRHLRRILLIFPEMRFVQMVRDGRDGAVSGWFHNQRVAASWTGETFPTMNHYVARYAHNWAEELQAGETFAQQHPSRYLRVRYEDLSTDPLPVLAGVCRFLEVDDDEEILRGCCAAASFERLSGGRHRGEERPDSFFRKGVSGDWRNHFDAQAEIIFRKASGDWLERLGYQ